MRPTKYRAFDKEAEQFFYTDQVYDEHYFEFDQKGNLIAYRIDYDAGTFHEPPEPHAEQIEDTQQFIGRKDKNGKEIFEGDICKTEKEFEPGEFVGFVDWHNGCFWLESQNEGMPFHIFNDGDCEIIGNIYKNPELLEKS